MIVVVFISQIVLELFHGTTASSGGAGPSGIDANDTAGHHAASMLHSVVSTFSLIPCSQCGISEARQGNNEQFDQNHIVLERSTENQALRVVSYSLIIFHATLRVPWISHRPSCAWLSRFFLAILSALTSCHN